MVCSALKMRPIETPKRLGALAIQFEVDLRRRGAEGRVDAGERRVLVGGDDETRRRRRRDLAVRAGQASADWNSNPAAFPRPEIGGRLKAMTLAAAICRNDRLSCASAEKTESDLSCAFIERLQPDDGHGLVRQRKTIDQAVAADGQHVLRPGPVLDHFLDLATTVFVRLSDEASGNWISAKKAP